MTEQAHQPWHHPACLSEEDLLEQCLFGKGRSSGPGGQHRNKVETAVMLTHEPTGVHAKAGERRSQSENKRVALKRLRLALATEHREGVPVGEIGSDLWRSRLRGTRVEINPGHWDYPSLLAEAMDVLADARWDPSRAALRLDTTASQIIKLIREHPPALGKLNEERKVKGKHTFH